MVKAEIGPWFLRHTQDELLERAAIFRVPAAPVSTGATVTALPHVVARGLFRPNPRGGFPDPRPPFRSSRTTPRPAEAAPRLGEHDQAPFAGIPPAERPARRRATESGGPPLEGVRIVDLTAFWAGPFGTQYLATLGADVIKVESVQRPDPMRFSVTVPPTAEQWYEQGSLFVSINLNKRGITLDLSRPRAESCSSGSWPRPTWSWRTSPPGSWRTSASPTTHLRAVRPDIILLRMPGWGLDGPWRDRPAFASTMEQVSGIAWITGRPDGPPELPGHLRPAGRRTRRLRRPGRAGGTATTPGRASRSSSPWSTWPSTSRSSRSLEHAAYGHLMVRARATGDRQPPHRAPILLSDPKLARAGRWNGR